MRIAQVNLQPDYGGAERYTLLLTEGLRERGHETALVCHPHGRLRKEAQSRCLNVQTTAARSQCDLRAVLGLSACLRRFRPDVIHLQTSKEYISGLFAARIARVPVVVVSRHMLVPVKPTMRCFFRRVDAIVVLSRAVWANMLHYGVSADKLNVIYAGIDTQAFADARQEGRGRETRRALGVPENRLLIGMAGRMVEGKGFACLLDAAAHLAQAEVSFTLLLIGEGPLRPALEAQARRLGLADRVYFTGFRPDMPGIMAALDVFVMASTCAEVMPMVLMEAMAAGCPIVATDVGGVGEIITPNRTGLLAPPDNAPALSDALRRLSACPILRAELSAAAYADVQTRFTLPRMIKETEQLYQRLCGAK